MMPLKQIKYLTKDKPEGKWSFLQMGSKIILLFLPLILFISGCGRIETLVSGRTPYEKYLHSLSDSGIIDTEAGSKWRDEGERVFNDSLIVTLPYKEVMYFSPARIYASGYMFSGARGENIVINLDRDTVTTSRIFMDLYYIENDERKHEISAEPDEPGFIFNVRRSGMYFLRIQPELFGGGKFYLDISSSPSLAFPVDGKDSRAIKSFWGDNRGKRKHEGVDIFASRGTPVLAAEDGIVTRTGTNNLGGKIVWLSTMNRNLYYAHLDSQAVSPPQYVKTGDTLGFVGNTGNARTTPPHLHFGIYYRGTGAVDPMPYIKNFYAAVDEPEINEEILNSYARVASASTVFYSHDKNKKQTIPANTPLLIKGGTNDFYKSVMHNGKTVYINRNSLNFSFNEVTNNSEPLEMHFKPDSGSIITGVINPGELFNKIGSADGFSLISHSGNYGWIKD
jgi:peptidoglycan LD-endopeptidase LytH